MSTTEEVVPMEEEKSVMLVAIDDSEHSYYALEWTLENFFSSPETSLFKLVVLHVLPPPITTLAYAGPGPVVTANMQQGEARKTGEKVMEKAKEICQAKSVNNVIGEVIEGDARNALCEAVEKHHASVLVVGSHGYGAIKRAVLGSVSDYCAHHAHCSVMIVKKPKHKSTNNN